MIHINLNEEQQKIAQQMFDDRISGATDGTSYWHPNEWDYTEWEEFYEDVRHKFGYGSIFEVIDLSFLDIPDRPTNVE